MDTEEAISFQYKLWHFLGLNSAGKSAIFMLYSVANYVFSGLIVFCCFVRLFKSGGMGEICFVMFHAVIIGFSLVKFINLRIVYYKLGPWRRTTINLDKHFSTKAEQTVFLQSIKLIKTIFFTYLAGVLIGVSCVEIFVVICHYNDKDIQIVPIWTPFDTKSNELHFWMINVSQYVISLYQCCHEVAVDCVGPVYMSVVVGHINTLSHRIRLIGYGQEKSSDIHYQDLIYCIQDHQLVLR